MTAKECASKFYENKGREPFEQSHAVRQSELMVKNKIIIVYGCTTDSSFIFSVPSKIGFLGPRYFDFKN